MTHDTPDNLNDGGQPGEGGADSSRSRNELLGAYHDGELNSADREAVAAMLARDAEARRELEALRSLSRSFSSVETPALPAGALDAVRSEIDRLEDRAVLMRISGWAAGLAAMVLISCSLLLGAGVSEASAAARTADPFADASVLLQLQSDEIAPGESQTPVEAHLSELIASELLAAEAGPSLEGR